MIKKVYRNNLGHVINIGEWDYFISYNEHGEEVINNPLPEGTTFSEEEIVILSDGGLSALNHQD